MYFSILKVKYKYDWRDQQIEIIFKKIKQRRESMHKITERNKDNKNRYHERHQR